MKIWNATATVTLGALLIAVPHLVMAQSSYPFKTVRVIVPFPPGGPNDIVARILFQKVSMQLGQPFMVENRGGASGTIGAELVARSAADGYTILVHSATHISNAFLYKKLPYDTLTDFTAVTPLAVQVAVMAVHPSMPVRSIRDLIALANARPGHVTYASSGNGTFSHLAMALFVHTTGISVVHIPYKGAGPATTALASGETQAMVVNAGALLPYIRSGRVRPLAVTSEKRLAQLPDLPTFPEAGVSGYELRSWVACFLPRNASGVVVSALNGMIKNALEATDVKQLLSDQTLYPWHLTPDAFERRLKDEHDKYGKLIRMIGVRAD